MLRNQESVQVTSLPWPWSPLKTVGSGSSGQFLQLKDIHVPIAPKAPGDCFYSSCLSAVRPLLSQGPVIPVTAPAANPANKLAHNMVKF